MIVVITGSRDGVDLSAIGPAVEAAVTGPLGGYGALSEVEELWHGDARGVDRAAAGWAAGVGITPRPWPATEAEWKRDPRLAGKRRNWRMLAAAKATGKHVVVVAVWDGLSGGTAHAIGWAVAMGLPVAVTVAKAGGAQ